MSSPNKGLLESFYLEAKAQWPLLEKPLQSVKELMWRWFTLVSLKMQEKLHFTFNTSGWRLIHKMWPWSKAFLRSSGFKEASLSVQALSMAIGTEILFSACAVCCLRGIYSMVCYTVNVGSAIRYHCKYEHDLHLPGTAWYDDMMI